MKGEKHMSTVSSAPRALALGGIVAAALAVLSAGAAFAEDDVVLDGFSVGPVKLMARERGAWKVDFRREAEGGVEYAVVEMTSDREDSSVVPPNLPREVLLRGTCRPPRIVISFSPLTRERGMTILNSSVQIKASKRVNTRTCGANSSFTPPPR